MECKTPLASGMNIEGRRRLKVCSDESEHIEAWGYRCKTRRAKHSNTAKNEYHRGGSMGPAGPGFCLNSVISCCLKYLRLSSSTRMMEM